MTNYLSTAFRVLDSVYREGAYATIALDDCLKNISNAEKGVITRIVYGVIERHEEFSFMIKKLCSAQPKPVIRVILRMGMYLVKYMESIPNYAAVNGIVELVKGIGKPQLTAFVNATLKNYIEIMNKLPDDEYRLSIDSNMPMWLIEMYINDYGRAKALDIINKRVRHTHLRHNSRTIKQSDLEKMLIHKKVEYKRTKYGFLINSTDSISEAIDKGNVTVQALCSMLICKALTPHAIRGKILDVCAAPGGKSLYLSELNPEAKIIAQDIYPHRVKLITAYKNRMKAQNIKEQIADSTIFIKEYANAFHAVIADVPCSGLGIIGSNPDIVINRTKADIVSLIELQAKILATVSKYVKQKGVLVYSTCSNLKGENENIVKNFLKQNKDFVLEKMDIEENNEGMHQFFTDDEGHEGFFVCRMVRK